ncbi:MAG: alpha/beta fold hydrolase [Paracoccaceae bacterium]
MSVARALAHLEHRPAAGAETAPPLVIAHGLYGARRNFNAIAKALAADRRVIAVDMRNHGASPWDEDCSYPAMAEDLAHTVERLAGPRAVVLGHSMGGKAAMALALTRPDLLAGLVVADIAPVAYAHSHLGYLEAMRAVPLEQIGRRGEADPHLADAVPDAGLRAFLLQNLVIEDGRARWRINLDGLAAGMPELLGWPPDWPTRYEGPALFLRGGASDYVPPGAEIPIRALFPRARLETIEGAGHWLHAEEPKAFTAAVRRFLDE